MARQGFASAILMFPFSTRIWIVGEPPPLIISSIFMLLAEAFAEIGRLLKSLAIFPCAAAAKRWKAASVGKETQAFPCATLTSAENFSSSHQSYESVSVPRFIVRSTLVKQ